MPDLSLRSLRLPSAQRWAASCDNLGKHSGIMLIWRDPFQGNAVRLLPLGMIMAQAY